MTATDQQLQASKNFMQAANRLPTLFKLADDFRALVDLLEDPEADPEAVDAELQRAAGDIERKAHGVAVVIQALEGLADYQKAARDVLAAKEKANRAHAERLRQYALVAMKTIGQERLETGVYTLKIALNNPSVQVLDAAAIPSEFNRTKITIEPDKIAILAHAKAGGQAVPGTEIVRTERLAIS